MNPPEIHEAKEPLIPNTVKGRLQALLAELHPRNLELSTKQRQAVADALSGRMQQSGLLGEGAKQKGLDIALEALMPAAKVSGVLGTIRPGGQKDLLLSHETDLNYLRKALEPPFTNNFSREALKRVYSPVQLREKAAEYQNLQTLKSPSMAISRFDRPFSPHSEAVLYPNPNLLDPAVNKEGRVDVFGNDAFTYRKHQYEDMLKHSVLRKNPKLREGEYPATYSHLAAVLEAKKYPSFKAFEEDPRGAPLLVKERPGSAEYDSWNRQFNVELGNWMKKNGYSSKMINEVIVGRRTPERPSDTLMIQDFLNDPENHLVKEFTQYLPVGYAETKLHGKLPLTAPYISAVQFPDVFDPMKNLKPELIRPLQRRGIKVFGNMPREDLVEALDKLHGLQGK